MVLECAADESTVWYEVIEVESGQGSVLVDKEDGDLADVQRVVSLFGGEETVAL